MRGPSPTRPARLGLEQLEAREVPAVRRAEIRRQAHATFVSPERKADRSPPNIRRAPFTPQGLAPG